MNHNFLIKPFQERDFINQMNENIFPGVPIVCVCVRHERLQLCPKQPQTPPSPPPSSSSGHPPRHASQPQAPPSSPHVTCKSHKEPENLLATTTSRLLAYHPT